MNNIKIMSYPFPHIIICNYLKGFFENIKINKTVKSIVLSEFDIETKEKNKYLPYYYDSMMETKRTVLNCKLFVTTNEINILLNNKFKNYLLDNKNQIITNLKETKKIKTFLDINNINLKLVYGFFYIPINMENINDNIIQYNIINNINMSDINYTIIKLNDIEFYKISIISYLPNNIIQFLNNTKISFNITHN